MKRPMPITLNLDRIEDFAKRFLVVAVFAIAILGLTSFIDGVAL